MKFGKNLQRSIYAPWKDKYLDYGKLKALLREDADDDDGPWTENDESAFVEELLNVQLEKVNAFQAETYRSLGERMGDCEGQLEHLAQKSGEGGDQSALASARDEAALREVLTKLDGISKEISELEKYCRLNFTGAIKMAKKHDRRRGTNYRIRPILQVRLASLPFNSEDYSPLLYRLSSMYTFVRQRLDGVAPRESVHSNPRLVDQYSSYKFFVHPDNLLEVKTFILRHLPVLVYSPSNKKVADGAHDDPTVTSLYFDNPEFSLYNKKISKGKGASSLRIRWFGPLADKPELMIEKKTIQENDASEELRFPIKEKYVTPFVKGEYHMEKSVQKLRDRKGEEDSEAANLESNADDIQQFIKEYGLQPIVRANYTRTAFQIPGEDRVRASIDTNLVMIREDALDDERPCRDPDTWHRQDIEDERMTYPFRDIRKGEITRFPYSVLEIKVRESPRRKPIAWVEELMSSHLVKEASRFSKFVHGVASLFEDYVNIFPFWMSLMETDIRKDPGEAFEEEQERRAKQAEDEFAVGSFLGSSMAKASFRPAARSPITKAVPSPAGKAAGKAASSYGKSLGRTPPAGESAQEANSEEDQHLDEDAEQPSGLRAYFSTLSTSRYARAKRVRSALPPGVSEPTSWLKDAGPLQVEPKVWLANQRTFVKWEHISVLLATLALTLYNAAGPGNDVARVLGVTYTLIALFAGIWGWGTYMQRSRMIARRSGKDFDRVLGPVIVCVSLAVALGLNFVFQYRRRRELLEPLGPTALYEGSGEL